jgi:alpha-amylase/alpha-mannosidase (GH57 family)
MTNRIHLVILWHMHQPQYRDPATQRYFMPWTRLHALKDYWGIVKMLEEFPSVHATLNVVPSLGLQLEEYAGGQFREPWFELATRPVEGLEPEDKAEILAQGFQANRDTMIRRWPRYWELFQRAQEAGADAAEEFGPRDWCDLQVLSQLAWMDEEYLGHDAVVCALAQKGASFTEEDKDALREKQLELLGRVLPEYRAAMARGQIEISTTPYYHPILPLICDSNMGRVSNPAAPVLQPAFRHPEDAREQLRRAREYHERVFGRAPTGLWPSEGSVSDETLELAAEMGFRWFASDEGVLGRTLNVGFGRDASGVPDNAGRLYAPLRVRRGEREIVGVFRDHYLSDLIGFVYNRMDQAAAAEDLHRRIRLIGERVKASRLLTLALIVDGENAWEYFQRNGREFLRHFYRRVESDPDIRPLTVSEAIAEAGKMETVEGIFPGSWINANFDVWIGHAEDVQAWHLLREARDFYAQAEQKRAAGGADAPSPEQLAESYESVLAAEGSDWCWWYGPEHSSSHDAEFDALYRRHLTGIYAALGAKAPETLAQPIKKLRERALVMRPTAALEVRVDGRETSYFEWMGGGLYSADRQGGAMHGRVFYLHELYYGFDEGNLYLRVDAFRETLEELHECEFVVHLRAEREVTITARLEGGRLDGVRVEAGPSASLRADAEGKCEVAFANILELRIVHEALGTRPGGSLTASVALWHGGLPVDRLPADGTLELQLTTEGTG